MKLKLMSFCYGVLPLALKGKCSNLALKSPRLSTSTKVNPKLNNIK